MRRIIFCSLNEPVVACKVVILYLGSFLCVCSASCGGDSSSSRGNGKVKVVLVLVGVYQNLYLPVYMPAI